MNNLNNFNGFNGFNNINSWNNKFKRNNKRYSAGILPYTFDQNGKLLFLLGKDTEGDWSDFGGRSEFKDNNEPINTATREFYEETLGSVINISECLEKIRKSNNKIVSKTLNGSPYHMYLIHIDFFNYSESFNKITQFLKYQFDSLFLNKIIEKVNIRWFTKDTIVNCLENRENREKEFSPIPLRGVFYNTMSEFKDSIISLQK